MKRLPPIPIAVALLLALLAPVWAEGTAPFEDLERSVRRALKSDEADVRARALDLLNDCADPRAVQLIIDSVQDVKKAQEKIRKEQVTVEKQFETQFQKKVELDQWLDRSSRSGRDLDKYNKSVKKIRRKIDQLHLELKNLENDYTRARAQIDGAVQTMATVISNLGTEDLNTGLALLDEHWRDGSGVEEKLWWIDTLAGIDRPSVPGRLRAAVKDPRLPVEVRAAALQTLGDHKDPTAHDTALRHLEDEDPASWDMVAAAIQVMKLLHEKRSIEPLITFLKREDIKRLREDAHDALKSLTGEQHGPYFDPWNRWWEQQGDTFVLPKEPVVRGTAPAPGEGVTFYGVHTFSDRVLFILDVSGSMDQRPKKEGGGRGAPKIEVAREELIGAINALNDGDRFNVIFFNHEVVTWQRRMVDVSDSTRRRARKWIEDQEPLGGTNIHDALEAGFEIALRATGEPVIDTIFFLTDGNPTAGKIQEPEKILSEVADWNRTARVKIHAIGVGKHDQAFMEALAKLGGGTYVRR